MLLQITFGHEQRLCNFENRRSRALEVAIMDQSLRSHSEEKPALTSTHTFWKGRVAFHAILKVLGVTAGHCVLVPGYTGFSMPSAIIFTGATPIYVDIEPDTYNVSLKTIQAACSAYPEANIKAVMVQHTYGIPA